MNNPRGTWTLFLRETKRFMKVYLQTILAPVVGNLLFLAIFGLSISRDVPIEGVTYLQFLVPGLIIMGIINNAYQNPSSSLIIMKYQGLISDLMTIPLKRGEIFLAFMGSAVLRAFIIGIMTFLTASFFVDFPYYSIPMIFLTATLVALFFSSLGFAVGVWAKEFDQQAFIQTFILVPLTFLGGVFYPVSKLPEFFHQISRANPIVYMIDLLRYGFTGIHEFSIIGGLSVISAVTIFTTFFAYYLLHTGYRLQN